MFVATAGTGGSCGEGSKLLRIDDAGAWSPDLSMIAVRNMTGENRISEVRQLVASPDGKRVLARTADAVHVLDADLRLRGTLQVKGAVAVAWVEGTGEDMPLFGIAHAAGVTVYEPVRMTARATLHMGEVNPDLLVMYLAESGEVVAAATPAGRAGIAMARVRLDREE